MAIPKGKRSKIFRYHILAFLYDKEVSYRKGELLEPVIDKINNQHGEQLDPKNKKVDHDVRAFLWFATKSGLLDTSGKSGKFHYSISNDGIKDICFNDVVLAYPDYERKSSKRSPIPRSTPKPRNTYWLRRYSRKEKKLAGRESNRRANAEATLFDIDKNDLFFLVDESGAVDSRKYTKWNSESIDDNRHWFKCPGAKKKICNGNWDESVYEIEIDKKTFKKITSIGKLPSLNGNDVKKILNELEADFYIKKTTLEQILTHLISGKNILLTGPVGSGKTHLASNLPRIAWKYSSEVYTATTEWTAQDVIGGIYPKVSDDGKVTYRIKPGCVYDTVVKNSDCKADMADDPGRGGVWLVIDEFNRANIDHAFGQLFTALEYRTLKVPTTGSESFEEKHILGDYRIIGTLNTADKHFLHTLSDALKRRFAIVEIGSTEERYVEMKYVVKKVLKDLRAVDPNNENIENVEKISKQLDKIVKSKKSGNGSVKTSVQYKEKHAERKQVMTGEEPWISLRDLHNLLSYIRRNKPLGTELLISMFKFILMHHSMNDNWDKSLDMALTATVLPQLESLPYQSLEIIKITLDKLTDSKSKAYPDADNKPEYRIPVKHLYDHIKYLRDEDDEWEKNPKDESEQTPQSELIELVNEWQNNWSRSQQKNSISNLEEFRKSIDTIMREKDLDY